MVFPRFNRSFLPLMAPRINRLINEKNKIMPFFKRTIHLIQSGVIKNTMTSLLMPLLDKEFKENVSNPPFTHASKLRKVENTYYCRKFRKFTKTQANLSSVYTVKCKFTTSNRNSVLPCIQHLEKSRC